MKPERDTAIHSKDEIVRRLLYLLYIASAIGGVGLLVASAVKRSFAHAAVAIVVVGMNLLLHRLGRRRLGFDDLKRDIRGNPFKQTEAGERDKTD